MDAFQCLLDQTYQNWELVICDDGSTDGTPQLLQELQSQYPDKVVAIANDENRGLNYTLNHCLEHVQGEFIARMDADDLCSPDRFTIELQAFEDDPDLAFASTDMELFDGDGIWGVLSHPEYPTPRDFLAGSPFNHGSVMIRAEALKQVGNYSVDDKLLRIEDYHLWLKLYEAGFKGRNIHIPLYQARDDRAAEGRRTIKNRLNESRLRFEIVRAFGLNPINNIYAIKPILTAMLPSPIYRALRRKMLQS